MMRMLVSWGIFYRIYARLGDKKATRNTNMSEKKKRCPDKSLLSQTKVPGKE